MNPKDSAFQDALVIVATSNTANYLVNRFRSHPLVQYLVDTFSLLQIKNKLLVELGEFDGSLTKTTVILLLTQAMINKSEAKRLPSDVVNALRTSRVMWVRDLLSIAHSVKDRAAVTISQVQHQLSPSVRFQNSTSGTSSSFMNGRLN